MRQTFSSPLLCYVTDRLSLASSTPANQALLRTVQEAAAAGVDWIQLREKDLSGKDCAALTREALLRISNSSTATPAKFVSRLIINDRLDIALAERAAGVHLGENSLPMFEVRELLRTTTIAKSLAQNFLAGVSCHSLDAAQSAAAAGASYIFFGPIFATPSKASYGAPQGLPLLSDVCRSVPIPVLAIGGITLENAASCLKAGAAGIAAIRLFQNATQLPSVVDSLRALKF